MINAEVEQLREVIRRYMDAGRKGDRDTLLSCFHRDARVSGYLGDRLLTGMPSLLTEEALTSGTERSQAELLALSITGRIADAVVYEAGTTGRAGLEQHLQLIEDGGAWRIISNNFTSV